MILNDEHENIETKLVGDNIIINIPVDTLFYAMNHRMYLPLEIHSRKEMVEYVVAMLVEWGGDGETGSTAFEDFLDAMFTDALKNGEDWLDFNEEDE